MVSMYMCISMTVLSFVLCASQINKDSIISIEYRLETNDRTYNCALWTEYRIVLRHIQSSK